MKFKRTIPIALSIITTSILAPLVVSCNNSGEVIKEATIKVISEHGDVKLSLDGKELNEEEPKVEVGKTLKVEVTPDENYACKSIKLGAGEVTSTNVAEFVIKDTGNVVLEVFYEKIINTTNIIINNSEHGSIRVKNEGLDLTKVPFGTIIELEVTPNEGYQLDKVLVNDEVIDELQFTCVDGIFEYIVKATFVKEAQESILATLEVQNISGSTGASLSLTTNNFKTTNVGLTNVTCSNCYNEEGLIRVSSRKNGGNVNFELDKNYLITGVKIYGQKYNTDQSKVTLEIGSKNYLTDFENVTYIPLSDAKEVNSFTISSEKQNRFMISKIELEINGSTGGGTVDPTPDPEEKEATVEVNQIGEGAVELDKVNGFAGDVIKAKIVPATNFYIYTIKFNGEYTFLDSQSEFLSLTLKGGVNTLEVIFKEKGTEGEQTGFSHLYDNNRIKPTRGSQGSYDSYYEPVRGLKGEALKKGLNAIIKGHKTFSYSSLNEAMKVTDVDPFNSNNIIFTYEGSLEKNKSYNKEHTWAKSVGDFGTSQGPGSDMHHLRPSHSSLNSTRSNFDFAEVSGGKDCGEAFSWSRESMKGNLVGNNKFEPKDEFKGDVARMIFYMATRYEGNDSYLDLEVGGSKGSLDGIDTSKYYTFGSATGIHGCFNDLYNWATTGLDPVSDFEVNRNNIIDDKYQHNRNPFIDHPEFIIMIYDKNYNGPGALNDK